MKQNDYLSSQFKIELILEVETLDCLFIVKRGECKRFRGTGLNSLSRLPAFVLAKNAS